MWPSPTFTEELLNGKLNGNAKTFISNKYKKKLPEIIFLYFIYFHASCSCFLSIYINDVSNLAAYN